MSGQGARIIPRATLLSKSARGEPAISPDGRSVAWLAPHQGAQNIWLAPIEDVAAACVLTSETSSAIRAFWWSASNSVLLVSKDATGSEETDLYAFDVVARAWLRLSPLPSGQTRLVTTSASWPDEILLETNGENPQLFNVWRVNIHTGAGTCVLRNDRFAWLHADTQLRVRVCEVRNDDGSVSFHAIDADGQSRSLIEVPAEDETTTRPLRYYEVPNAFGPGDAEIYATDSRGRNTTALVAWNLTTGASRLIGADDRADVAAVLVDAKSREVAAWVSDFERPSVHAMAPVAKDLAALRDKLGDIWIVDQTPDGRHWIVAAHASDRDTIYAAFDRERGRLTPLYDGRPELSGLALAPMTSHVVRARDGLELVCYVTRPLGAPAGPLPTVVLIHGGPWIRDTVAFDPWVQLLANRGYCVLTVNFRGSRGFGKAFLNAGDREWGGAMLDDVLDAVAWAINEKLAMPGKIAAMGFSYGGYCVLAAMARAGHPFACGIDVFGISNLQTFLESIPPQWNVLRRMWSQRVGDIETAEGRAFLASRSPLHAVDRMSRPMLIVHGAADPRVAERESRQIATALDANGVETSYVLFPNEGHNFFQLANELTFWGCVEGFLAKHLGGVAEPFGEEVGESTATVPIGLRHIPGLETALTARAPDET